MGYSLIFGNFLNALLFHKLAVFWSRFLHKTTLKGLPWLNRFEEMFLAIFFLNIFHGLYSLSIVAIFPNFQNALIFRILAVFWSRFLHRTTAMSCRNVFTMFLCILNFWAKVTILQSLYPLLDGHFCQFSKCSHFANISCFMEPFFA